MRPACGSVCLFCIWFVFVARWSSACVSRGPVDMQPPICGHEQLWLAIRSIRARCLCVTAHLPAPFLHACAAVASAAAKKMAIMGPVSALFVARPSYSLAACAPSGCSCLSLVHCASSLLAHYVLCDSMLPAFLLAPKFFPAHVGLVGPILPDPPSSLLLRVSKGWAVHQFIGRRCACVPH